MFKLELSLTRKSLLYSSKTLLGAALCWYILRRMGIADPIWGIITIILVSDPDAHTTAALAKTRIINTIVGCLIGLLSLLLFGYSPWVVVISAALTVLLITSYERYPSNWRLAPVTVVILMDAARDATTLGEQLTLALMRASEIAFGCCIAMLLALIYTHLAPLQKEAP